MKEMRTEKFKKSTSGITLIALVVTIVILIILASISINAVVGENGLIAKAEQVKHEVKISEYEESIKRITLNEHTGKILYGKEDALKILVKTALEKESWVAVVEEDSEDDSKLIVYTTDGYRLVEEILEKGDVVVDGDVDDGEPYLRMQITRLELEGTENVVIYARYYEEGVGARGTALGNIQNVDNVDPTISSYDAEVEGTTITAEMTATDEASQGAAESGIAGIRETKYSMDGTNYQTENTFTITEGGTYTIYFKAVDNAGNEKVERKDVTVATSTITYNANEGTGAPSAHSTISGTNITLSNIEPTREGYTFEGWSISSTATSAEYSAGQTIQLTADMNLYAVWTTNTYTINYELNSGISGTNAPTSGTYGSVVTISNPTRTGYTFTGWTVTSGLNTSTAKYGTSASSVTTAISSTSTKITAQYFLNLTATSGGTVTLTANWQYNRTNISVTAVGDFSYSGDSTYLTVREVTTSGYFRLNLYAGYKIKFTSVTFPNSSGYYLRYELGKYQNNGLFGFVDRYSSPYAENYLTREYTISEGGTYSVEAYGTTLLTTFSVYDSNGNLCNLNVN